MRRSFTEEELDADPAPFLTSASGPPMVRADVQHDGPESRAAHAGVVNSDHVLDAGPGELLGIGR